MAICELLCDMQGFIWDSMTLKGLIYAYASSRCTHTFPLGIHQQLCHRSFHSLDSECFSKLAKLSSGHTFFMLRPVANKSSIFFSNNQKPQKSKKRHKSLSQALREKWSNSAHKKINANNDQQSMKEQDKSSVLRG